MRSDRLSRGCDKLNNGFISIMSGCDEPVGLTLSTEQAGDGGSPVLAEGHDKDVIRTERRCERILTGLDVWYNHVHGSQHLQ